jgi:hypothetical protein
MKIKLCILFILIVNTSFSQFSLDEILKFKIGLNYNIAKPLIKNKFQNDITLWKGDFFNSVLIKCNKPFDDYGEAEYQFSFMRNKLVTILISFEFSQYDQLKVMRVLRNMLSDLKKYSPEIIDEYTDLILDEVPNKIDVTCKQISEGIDPGTYIGREFAFLDKKLFPDNKVVRIVVANAINSKTQFSNDGSTSETTYNCLPSVTLWISNEKMWSVDDTLTSSDVQYVKL